MIPSGQETTPVPERFYGNHRGRVVDVNDPLQMGRVRVRVSPMFTDLPVADIPWAIPAWPLGSAGLDAGHVNVPPAGTPVWVFFDAGDQHHPNYWAVAGAAKDNGKTPLTPEESRQKSGKAWASKLKALVKNIAKAKGGAWSEPEPRDPAKSKYPLNRVYKTPGGMLVEIDDTPGARRINLYHAADSWLEFDETGTTILHTAGDAVRVTLKDERVFVKENFDLTAGKAVGIKAPEVTIEAQSINLGGVGMEPVPLGNQLVSWLAAHVHPADGAPAANVGALSTILSKITKLSG